MPAKNQNPPPSEPADEQPWSYIESGLAKFMADLAANSPDHRPDPPRPAARPGQRRPFDPARLEALVDALDVQYGRPAPPTGPVPSRSLVDHDPDTALSEADLCERYLATHQPLAFANGRFWRKPLPRRPWVPVSETQIAAELLTVLHQAQDQGLAPSRHRLRSALELLRLRSATAFDLTAWDQSAGLLPFLDGVWPVDGTAHDFRPYEADDLIATTFPYSYSPLAECPHWLAFLQAAVPHAAGFLQEFAGYCLTTDVHHELSLWVSGPPSSGKSTLLHGLQVLLGDFASRLSLPALARGRLDPAALAGKRLLLADEVPPTFSSFSQLSALIDGAPLHLERLHHPPVEVRSYAKLILGFTGLPAVDGRAASLYRRAALLVLPPRPPGVDDPLLKARLSQEGPGLFNWALAGLHRLQARGRFEPPVTLLQAAERLRLAASSPRDFVAQHCLLDPNARTQASHLIHAYRAWCDSQQIPAASPYVLAQHWRNLGFEHFKIDGRCYWGGVQLITADLSTVSTPPLAPELPSEPGHYAAFPP